MKRFLILFLILGLVFGSIATADAKKKKKKKTAPVKIERVVELEYAAPGIGVNTPAASGGICPFADPTTQECIEIPLQADETFIKVEMTDATGLPVMGYISQGDTDGDGIGNLYGDFCGGHPEPIAMESTNPVRISFYNGVNPDCLPSAVTTGSIKVTLSNLP